MARRKQQKPVEIPLLDNRRYTVEEKMKIVAQIEQGILSFNEALEQYKISARKTLYGWVTTYATEPDLIQKGKKYSYSHRRQIAISIQAGMLTVEDAARASRVSITTIEKWLDLLKHSTLIDKSGNTMRGAVQDNETQSTIAALQLKVSALETMIDLAEEKWKIDIRKKCGTKQQ